MYASHSGPSVPDILVITQKNLFDFLIPKTTRFFNDILPIFLVSSNDLLT